MLIFVDGIAVDFAKCIHCNLVLDSNVTSSMVRHQKNGTCETQCQKIETIGEQARQLVAEQQSNETKRPDVKLTTEEKEKIKSMSALLCAQALIPFSLFDNPVFHSYCQMISDIGAKYGAVHYKKNTPSGKTASRATMQLDQANKNVKAEIKQVSDVAITTDHWTDPIGHKVQADWIAKEIESERSTNNKLHSECIKIEALSSIIQMECFKAFMKIKTRLGA